MNRLLKNTQNVIARSIYCDEAISNLLISLEARLPRFARNDGKNKQAGYSLVEMLIVVAIIGIMSAIAGLAYKTWTDKYNVERQTKEMYVDLMKARVNAMSRGKEFFVWFPAQTGITQYAIYEDTTNADGTPAPDGNGYLETASDREVSQKTLGYSLRTNTPVTIEFTTKGRITNIGTIRTEASYGSAYDCITLHFARINMGRLDDKGTASTADDECVAK